MISPLRLFPTSSDTFKLKVSVNGSVEPLPKSGWVVVMVRCCQHGDEVAPNKKLSAIFRGGVVRRFGEMEEASTRDHCNNSAATTATATATGSSHSNTAAPPELPTELWELIVEALPRGIDDLLSLSLVNHRFHGVASSDRFWRPLGKQAWFTTASDKTCKQHYMEWLRAAAHQYRHSIPSRTLTKVEDTAESDHYPVKLILSGESEVGKTSVMLRLCSDEFSPMYLTTIGIDFQTVYEQLGKHLVKLQIWDTAGQLRFRAIAQAYYRYVYPSSH
eukprot:TRINITY_DN111_c0_g1_i9.p1 TRINITY_DN111_c0_g1~~TRINITY_DN111_c0_g1_i9.p1  ORF type:complete len:275 (+),score=28.52 TRINITY_DN111_c0_g1_i9:97-921(+)